VHHESHVRSIDAHTERHRRDDDVDAFLEKSFLVLAAHGVGEARVVRDGPMPFFDQPRRQRFNVAPRQAVHNARLAVVPFEDASKLVVKIAAAKHAVRQVRAIEGPDQNLRRRQAQLFDNVGSNALGGGGGKRMERHAGEVVAQPSELAVLGSEIVAPLADAVRFIDGDKPDAGLMQDPPQRRPAVTRDSLRRNVQQAAAIFAQARHDGIPLVGSLAAVQIRRRYPVHSQAVHLILHE
jgi:hypothetical protein